MKSNGFPLRQLSLLIKNNNYSSPNGNMIKIIILTVQDGIKNVKIQKYRIAGIIDKAFILTN